MVARKRIKHGPRKRGNADLRNRRHVPLNRAAIDSVADKDESKMEKEDDADSEHAEGDEEDGDDEDEESKEQGN